MILEKQRGKRQMSREPRKGKQIKSMSLKEKYEHMFIFNAFILERHSLLCYQNSYQSYISFSFFFPLRNVPRWLALAAEPWFLSVDLEQCRWNVVLRYQAWTCRHASMPEPTSI